MGPWWGWTDWKKSFPFTKCHLSAYILHSDFFPLSTKSFLASVIHTQGKYMKGSLCILKAFQSKHTANTQVYYCYVNDILNFLWPQDATTLVGLRMASIHVFTSGILWALINNSGSSKKCEHHHYVFLHRYLYFDCKEYSQRPVFWTTIKRASFLCCSFESKMPQKCLPMETGESEHAIWVITCSCAKTKTKTKPRMKVFARLK